MHQLQLDPYGTICDGEKEISVNPLGYLGRSIVLDDAFTLASYFLMLKAHPELEKISDMIDPVMEMAAPFLDSGLKDESIDDLVFYKTIEIKGDRVPPELVFYNQLKGRVKNLYQDLKFFHIEALLGHRIALAPLEHVVFGDTQDSLQFNTFYTLFEFVEGIAWQLSFNFNPLQCSIRR